MSEVTNQCSSSKCSSCDKKGSCSIRKESPNEFSKINKVIGIVSGKGGVGKSTVTTLIARKLVSMGYRVGILDGDITGPSIPQMFGYTENAESSENGIEPGTTKDGIKIISMNMFLEDKESPVIYRGPVIASLIKQFWTDVNWGELDYLLVDMPPGTGDVPLTAYQSLPMDGIIVVTSPQNLVKMIVMKAINMASKMGIPLLGIVENYSYFICDKCDKRHYIYGEGKTEKLAEEIGTTVIAKLPISPEIASAADQGSDVDLMSEFNLDTIINL